MSSFHTPGITNTTHWCRGLICLAAAALLWFNALADKALFDFWNWLRFQPWFENQYFEAYYPLFFFPTCVAFWSVFDLLHESGRFPSLRQFKIQPDAKRSHPPVNVGPKFWLGAVLYVVPPALLEFRKSPRKYRLAEDIPGVWAILGEVVACMILFDVLFFLVHLAFHKVPFLFRHVHAVHHQDTVLRAADANWVHASERLSLVLCAAMSLTILQAHYLTRVVFTSYAVWELVANHSGWDFPWMVSNVVPLGLVSGSVRHEMHHKKSNIYFAEYFTWTDNVYQWLTSSVAGA